MSILRSYGYENVRSLVGGFSAWADAGYPVAMHIAGLDSAFATFLNEMEGYNTVSVEDTNLALIEDPPPFLLDVRDTEELEANGHIPGAVHIPLRTLAQNLDVLPNFDVPIIVYCGRGFRAAIGMTALEAMGGQDVKALTGGSFSGWVDAGYEVIAGLPPDAFVLEVAQPDPGVVAQVDEMLQGLPEGWGAIQPDGLNTALIEDRDLLVIDARRDEELAENGVIEAANLMSMPLEAFVDMQDNWPADGDLPLVIYCGSGHRSTIAMSILRSYGYDDVSSLAGGFRAWSEAGYPVAEFAAP